MELKVGKFKPEYAGKLNFYLSAVDGEMRTKRDEPTIGLLLCESHAGAVEYSLKDIAKAIEVSSYRVTHELPAPVRDELPRILDLEGVVARLKAELDPFKSEQEDEGTGAGPYALRRAAAGGSWPRRPAVGCPERRCRGELEAQVRPSRWTNSEQEMAIAVNDSLGL